MSRRLSALLLLAVTGSRAAPVVSEFMADNASGLVDASGRHPDWIEVHNPDAVTVNLAGWHLTDDAANKTKWTFPPVLLEAGQRLVVFASGDGVPDAGGVLHTNFSLDAGGEYLALIAPDGLTAATEFAPAFPGQFEDVSYGAPRARVLLLAPGAAGKALAAAAPAEGNWQGGGPFDDTAWTSVINGIGYNFNDTPVIPQNDPPCAAYAVPAGTAGNQNFTGPLGMDFSAERPLTVSALGAFDAGSDGFQGVIRVQLWSRNENGSPEYSADDTGLSVLADVEFSPANQGAADGGSRFLTLPVPITLPVGAYTIVAWGFGDQDMNGNAGIGGAVWATCPSNGAITFDGAGRFGYTPGTFPLTLDGGPANRYAAGTFKYSTAPADFRRTACRVSSGQAGNQAYGGPLGMDFVVTKNVRVASLGVFDDGSNGIAPGYTLTAQLWRRNDNGTPGNPGDDTGTAVLASQSFTAASGGNLENGSRFKPLAAPLELAPGAYTIVAWGYGAAERNGNAASPPWTTDGGAAGTIQFVGTSRYGTTGGSFPHVPDTSPANRYAAGTFQFIESGDPMIATDISAMLRNVSPGVYLRLPFTVANPADFSAVELEMASDDGFTAWINGVPAGSCRAPATLTPGSTATQAGAGIDTLMLSASMLQSGVNLVAVHGLNVSADDNDFLQRVQLTGVSALAQPRYFPAPSPGAAESGGVEGFLGPVAFSVEHGFFEAPFSVSLSGPAEGAEIRFTTDGSAPGAASTLYTSPLTISGTTVLRAAAFKAGWQPSVPNTRTYLFPDQVVVQNNTPAGYPSSWNAIAADYAMEDNAVDLAAILGQPAGTPLTVLRQQVKQALLALPAISIVTDRASLFDSATGIYTNPSGRGDLWEKACSAELIPRPGSSEAGFQINGGIQVMGLTSRNLTVNARLPLRVIFSRKFGPPSLHYPLYPGNPVTRFDSIALRNNTRDNWGYDPGSGIYIRDQWCREALAAMPQPAGSGRYVHLFLNGIYWGIYNPSERPDGDFCEEHLGGQAGEWDSVTLCCPNRAKSGTLTKWQQLMTLCTQGFETDAKYQFVQGNNPDGTRNPAWEVLLDVDSLAHFALSGYYHASGDWPGNFYAVRRNGPESTGFRFITWDSDLGFTGNNVNADKTRNDSGAWWSNSPGQIDLALRAHPEYRLRFADIAHRHLFNGGSLTPAVCAARFLDIAGRIEPALGAEGARWGDARGLATLTRWRQNRDWFVSSYFPNRGNSVLTQLRSQGLYPPVNAPVFNQHGGTAAPGFALTMSGAGQIYYTLDDSDPRLKGGGVSPAAQVFGAPVTLNATRTVKARVLSGGTWSALAEATFQISIPAGAANLVISEIHYNPAGPDDTEFVELMNIAAHEIDLTGVRFAAGIDFQFAPGTVLAPGGRVTVVQNAGAFEARYGSAIPVAGEFESVTALDNSGEQLLLLAAGGAVVRDFTYNDSSAWGESADGQGYSLTLIAPLTNPDHNLPESWRSSVLPGGSPGAGDALTFGGNPSVDSDGDGLLDVLEFAAGSDPASPAGGAGLLSFVTPAVSGAVRVSYARAPSDVILVLEQSSDLTSWGPAGASVSDRARLPGAVEQLTVTLNRAPPGRLCLRLRAIPQ